MHAEPCMNKTPAEFKAENEMDQASQARSNQEIEREFMNVNKSHSEGHWWAIYEINRLRDELARQHMDHIAAHRINVRTITWLEGELQKAKAG